VVIDRDREDLLGALLTNYILVKLLVKPTRRRDFVGEELVLLRRCAFFFDDLATEVDALVADIDAGGPGNQPPDLLLTLTAEGATISEAGVAGVSRWSLLQRRL
jgi:hypothetical protein